MLNTAIETETRNKDILKANLRDAVANGDTDAQADILMAINQTDNNLRQISEGKKHYEAQIRAPTVNKVEALASQLTPKSAEWVRANPDVVNDDRRAGRLQRAHFDALDDGIQPDTPDYFNFLETRLNINRAPQVQEAAMSQHLNQHQVVGHPHLLPHRYHGLERALVVVQTSSHLPVRSRKLQGIWV